MVILLSRAEKISKVMQSKALPSSYDWNTSDVVTTWKPQACSLWSESQATASDIHEHQGGSFVFTHSLFDPFCLAGHV